MKTLYTQYQEIESDIERMRFFFKNSAVYQFRKITRAKEGFYITTPMTKTYAEIDGKFILLYKVEGRKIGTCCGEIDLREFEENLKRNHDLITS